MKQVFKGVLGLVVGLLLMVPGLAFTQTLSAVPIDLEVPVAPVPVKAAGKMHLLYELHLTNFRTKSLELSRVEVIRDGVGKSSLTSLEGAELASRLARPGAPVNLADKRVIDGGMRAIVFVEIVVETPADVPSALRHRLFFAGEATSETDCSTVLGAFTTGLIHKTDFYFTS